MVVNTSGSNWFYSNTSRTDILEKDVNIRVVSIFFFFLSLSNSSLDPNLNFRGDNCGGDN